MPHRVSGAGDRTVALAHADGVRAVAPHREATRCTPIVTNAAVAHLDVDGPNPRNVLCRFLPRWPHARRRQRLSHSACLCTIWDARSGKLLRTLDDQSDSPGRSFFSLDGTLLACGDWSNGTLRLRDGRTARLLRILKVHNGLIGWARPFHRTAPSSPPAAATAARPEKWESLGPAHGPLHWRTVGTHRGLVASVAFSPDGQRLASAGLDGVIRIGAGRRRDE